MPENEAIQSFVEYAVLSGKFTKTRDSTDAALDRGRAASVLVTAKPVMAV